MFGNWWPFENALPLFALASLKDTMAWVGTRLLRVKSTSFPLLTDEAWKPHRVRYLCVRLILLVRLAFSRLLSLKGRLLPQGRSGRRAAGGQHARRVSLRRQPAGERAAASGPGWADVGPAVRGAGRTKGSQSAGCGQHPER